MNNLSDKRLLMQIKVNMAIIITGLALSGVTAFPLETELAMLVQHSSGYAAGMTSWLTVVYHAVSETNRQYPYLSYGTDWLAFAHLVLAILFIGPFRHPVKNIWVIQFGIIASLLIFPLAFIAGTIRGIPFFWRLIDCSFGIIAIVPLTIALKAVRQLETMTQAFYAYEA